MQTRIGSGGCPATAVPLEHERLIRAGSTPSPRPSREVKPKLRGWLHLATAPLTLAAGIVLIALSPTASTRVGSAVYAASALLLFTVSAIYHRGHWSPRSHGFLRRFDHANIFLLIAGSYTPFALLLLEGTAAGRAARRRLDGRRARRAVPGVLDRRAPWLYMPIYIAMGWAAVFFLPAFAAGSHRLGVGIGTAVLVLIIGRRRALHARRRRLRLQAAQPVAALVRLPRGVPHAHDPGVRHPLRRRLAGDVLPALTAADVGVTPRPNGQPLRAAGSSLSRTCLTKTAPP